MLIGVIADDFTGASDIANTLAKGQGVDGGLIVAQFAGTPNENNPHEIYQNHDEVYKEFEVAVIALKSRAIEPKLAIEQSLEALEWLLARGCEQIIFKYCSTFDSSPKGNIGPVAEALAHRMGVKGVIVCPAFPTMGRTIHQGHLFVNDALLNESGMEDHPQTPMADANLRRWLEPQCEDKIGLIAIDTVRQGEEAVRKAISAARRKKQTLVVCDATTDEDLVVLGVAAKHAKLITGGSGIAIGLPANFIERGKAKGSTPKPIRIVGTAPDPAEVNGKEAILVGSCSRATLEQVAFHARNHPTMKIDIDELMAGRVESITLIEFMMKNFGSKPLVYSSGTPKNVAALQKKYGAEAIGEKLDALYGATAYNLVIWGTKRFVIAGGETSGAVVLAMRLAGLKVGVEIDPGIPILVAERHRIALALKSGNFGSKDFFAKALEMLRGEDADD